MAIASVASRSLIAGMKGGLQRSTARPIGERAGIIHSRVSSLAPYDGDRLYAKVQRWGSTLVSRPGWWRGWAEAKLWRVERSNGYWSRDGTMASNLSIDLWDCAPR